MGNFLQYLTMGIEHILSGYDHLLFLCGLIIARMSKLDILKVLTAFTVGHCMTLALSSLELVSLPPSIIEPLIALSIVYITIENLFLKKLNHRWIVTLFFGLIHGFGFSEILRGTLSDEFVVPLFSFNLGVEVGQIMVLAAVLPLIWAFKQTKLDERILVSGGSAVVACFGLYWFVERMTQQFL
ncbi:HupE/UreJ family protein [Paenibacillus sp. BC26]|uniref:HupE/UreJ family protein n=1 Tax=Paenibacillus sp. BC26 TaxID=1881032 RepID=UPI0008EFFA0A|nr:HupE/UreJ family protein [Paenibacillus sp. BC26]SFT04828.1 HupE / UreJ protein [Paenibacillus sp. BC26]